MRNKTGIPDKQYAIQLTGPDELRLNKSKDVPKPTGYQILAQVEATGLCFSDLKLLKQFSDHPRKTEIVSGIAKSALTGNPSYMPGKLPTVPGHETIIKIVAVGEKVRRHNVGERCLVQTDYRSVRTAAGTNAAFGYNLEGGLQEYVIIDERISQDPVSKERFLIPVGDRTGRSAICLVEPWACVEDSYLTKERRRVRSGGKLLVVSEKGCAVKGLEGCLSEEGLPASVTVLAGDKSQRDAVQECFEEISVVDCIDSLPEMEYDDIIYFGSDGNSLEALNSRLAANGIINIVTGGRKIGRPVPIGIGRVHYGFTRWIGTFSENAFESYGMICETGEIRAGDNIIVIGGAGPMGQMHVIRNVCSGMKGIRVTATDFDEARLVSLKRIAGPLAERNHVLLSIINPQKTPLAEDYTYSAVMVPVPQLVTEAISRSAKNSLINIFAGIPAGTIHPVDLDMLIEKRCFMFGTSGSTLHDMKVVLAKVQKGALNTNFSVDAVSGMAGAIDGIRAVEKRTLAGKIIVYPQAHKTGLIPLSDLAGKFPTVAKKLDNGTWTDAAEQEFLRVAK